MNRKIWSLVAAAIVLVGGTALYFAGTQSAGAPPLLAAVTYTDDAGTNGGDGVAIVDLNPESDTFGKILNQYAIGTGVLPHHLYYNLDGSRFYATALDGTRLYELTVEGERVTNAEPIDTRDCRVGEDLFFAEDGETFYLTCMGSDRIMVFDAETHAILDEITADDPDAFVRYPHGIWIKPELDRMLVTETISHTLDDPGTHVTVIRASTGEVLSSHPLAKTEGQPSAPVEAYFHPSAPVAYITGMLDASLWVAVWNESTESFDFELVDDGARRGHSWPLEMYVGPDGHLYVSWAQPGAVDVYNLSDPERPRFMRSLPAGEGAHHILFGPQGETVFVQNNLLSLEHMKAGTITAVARDSGEIVGTIRSFIEDGMQPTSMVFLRTE